MKTVMICAQAGMLLDIHCSTAMPIFFMTSGLSICACWIWYMMYCSWYITIFWFICCIWMAWLCAWKMAAVCSCK